MKGKEDDDIGNVQSLVLILSDGAQRRDGWVSTVSSTVMIIAKPLGQKHSEASSNSGASTHITTF